MENIPIVGPLLFKYNHQYNNNNTQEFKEREGCNEILNDTT
jgi:hypothetical protein